MNKISHSDFDKLIAHTIRIELMDGNTLIYRVSIESKQAFLNTLLNENFDELMHPYLWIYIPNDRLVLINKKEIIRITFCFYHTLESEDQYYDNFSSIPPEEEKADNLEPDESLEDFIPQLIIMHNRQKEITEIVKGVTMSKDAYFDNISSYSSLDEDRLYGFEFNYLEDRDEFELLTSQYFQFVDDDGEDNFMPISNISVIEIERPFLMSDELLNVYLKRNL